MPLYSFKCPKEDCQHEFEERVPLTEFDTRIVKCTKCGTEAKRQVSAGSGPHTSWKHWRL